MSRPNVLLGKSADPFEQARLFANQLIAQESGESPEAVGKRIMDGALSRAGGTTR